MIIGIFSHFFAVETTLAERQFFRALAKLIGKSSFSRQPLASTSSLVLRLLIRPAGRRAARLSACGIASIVSKMGYLDELKEGEIIGVGSDGSLYNVSWVYPNSRTCTLTSARRNTPRSLSASTKAS